MLILRRVVGDSMLPSYTPRSFIIGIKAKKIKIGDVVIANLNSRNVLKRITRIKDSMIYIEGDNPDYSTDSRQHGPIYRADIIGKVIFKL